VRRTVFFYNTGPRFRLEQPGGLLPANVAAAPGERLLLLDVAEEDLQTADLQPEHATLSSQVSVTRVRKHVATLRRPKFSVAENACPVNLH
jgi:hypothetical protein